MEPEGSTSIPSTGSSTRILFYIIRLVRHPDTPVQRSLDEHSFYLEETVEPGPARKAWHILGRLLLVPSSHQCPVLPVASGRMVESPVIQSSCSALGTTLSP